MQPRSGLQHILSTIAECAVSCVSQVVASITLTKKVCPMSGGHGTRTRNPLRGTTFPVSPLAIRLPSEAAGRSRAF